MTRALLDGADLRVDQAADVLEQCGVVADLIEATARHSAEHCDAALSSDIDLSILGAPPMRYARFERDVRREYAMFEDAVYRQGRARVLRGFLECIQLYRTPRFATRLEAQARHNLSGALAALQAHV